MTRMSAAERRKQVLEAATVEFAHSGYFGASSQTIADQAGVSQPYLFQLFGSKLQLFIATWNACCDRIEAVLRGAAEDQPVKARARALAAAYDALLYSERDLLTLQLQAWAASCTNEDINTAVAERFNAIWELVASLSAAPSHQVAETMGSWVLYNVGAALNLERIDECAVSRAGERASYVD